MMSDWSTRHFARFLRSIATSNPRDAQGVLRAVVEAVEADLAAVISGDQLLVAVGSLGGDLPAAPLGEAADRGLTSVELPGIGRCSMTAVILESPPGFRLVAARRGEPSFVPDDTELLEAMAQAIGLRNRALVTLEEERELRARNEAQIRENLSLVRQLEERQALLERLAKINRSISHRAPFGEVLEAIVRGASELVNAEVASFRLWDQRNPETLVVQYQVGVPQEVMDQVALEPASRGVSGRSIMDDRPVVISDYPRFEGAVKALVDFGLQAAMAAPVRENGQVVGSLTVGSRQAGRVFTQPEQETLVAFAEHVSLALTDSKLAAAVQHQALHDALTDLPNRTLFRDRLGHALARARREAGSITGLLFIDLDRFKNVNDSLGHEAGDELLIQVGRRLRGSIREADTPARLGGDEFAVLVEGVTTLSDLMMVAGRIRNSLREPVTLAGREIFINPSIGVAASQNGSEEASELLRNADTAMYRAKQQGSATCVAFEPTMRAGGSRRLDLEAELIRAVERREFEVHYQPIIRLETEVIEGAEALVRWRHPTRGLIAPAEFIVAAEETGQIVPLGRLVLSEAIHQAAAWQSSPRGVPFTMSVNVSVHQLQAPGLLDELTGLCQEAGFDPAHLVLEITESVLMQDLPGAVTQLRNLKQLGIRLAIDDFGTGYSSLGYLRRFPIDVLKIDRAFVEGVAEGAEPSAVARAIIGLSDALHLATVAEGIETAGQLGALRALGCQHGQGYYFSRPVPAVDFEALLRAGSG